jgi:von Willebrand factor type A domain
MTNRRASALFAAAALLSSASAQGTCGSVAVSSGASNPTTSTGCKVPMQWTVTGGSITERTAIDIHFLVDESGSVGSSNFKNLMQPFAKKVVDQLVNATVFSNTEVNEGETAIYFVISLQLWQPCIITAMTSIEG